MTIMMSALSLLQGDDDDSQEREFPLPQFPNHEHPRVWFLTAADSPIGIALIRHLLEHGDSVVAAASSNHFEQHEKGCSGLFDELLNEINETEDWYESFLVLPLNSRLSGDCQAAIANAVRKFKRIDVLFCCHSEAVFGTVEELGQSNLARSAVQSQFHTTFFGPVNIIKSALPVLRHQKNGHILLLTGITGHLGTPGLSAYCASQWAIEGYVDSLAYEVAPFNIKISIIQSSIEVSVLTNPIISAPPMPEYDSEKNAAPLARRIFSRLLDSLEDASDARSEELGMSKMALDDRDDSTLGNQLLHANTVNTLRAPLPISFQEGLLAETLHALLAIGGHETPPARHIVGHEGVASVKEKLLTAGQELEEFVEVSGAADIS